MHNNPYIKKVFLLCVKYGPSIMALTCCLKLFFDSKDLSGSSIWEDMTHIINLILDYFIIGMFYIAGKCFNFCWKHESLCRIAAWGYLYYTLFLSLNTKQEIMVILTSWYLIFTIVITLLYKKL